MTFVKQFRHYLLGRPFLVRTDHSSLLWLKRFKNPEGILARLLAVLDTYDYTIEHRKGCLHQNADAMSRKPYSRCKRDDCSQCRQAFVTQSEGCDDGVLCRANESCLSRSLPDVPESAGLSTDSQALHGVSHNAVCSVNEGSDQSTSSNWLSLWSSEDIRSMQENDTELAEILKFRVESNQKPDRSGFRRLPDTMKYFFCHWESLEEKDGILYFRKESENPSLNASVLVAPKEIRRTLFENLHAKKTAAQVR